MKKVIIFAILTVICAVFLFIFVSEPVHCGLSYAYKDCKIKFLRNGSCNLTAGKNKIFATWELQDKTAIIKYADSNRPQRFTLKMFTTTNSDGVVFVAYSSILAFAVFVIGLGVSAYFLIRSIKQYKKQRTA